MKRNQNPLNTVVKRASEILPSMRFKDGDFSLWQQNAKEKLEELLGLPLANCDDLFSVEYEKERDEYNEIRFTFQSEDGYFVPCHLLIPKGVEKLPPLVICLQGHSTGMHISLGRPKHSPRDEESIAGERDFAVGALKRGYCALTIEQRGMGECGGAENGDTACHIHTMPNLLIGRTTIGERVWDIMRALDVVTERFSDVFDKDNIICLGNSGGGTAAFYTACLEERIKTAVVSCAFCGYDASIMPIVHCTCNFVPGIRKYFEMGDLGGLIAPRNLVVVSGKNDPIFPIDSAVKNFEITKKLYSYTNGKCIQAIGDGGHRFYYNTTWQAYDELVKY
ncbi:MAG: hypothetical protein IKA17_10325 [Clostridia bacterium]|nr:hypothetical protein [Clostridia bacterium]